MHVLGESLTPGVQHGGHAQLTPQAFGVNRKPLSSGQRKFGERPTRDGGTGRGYKEVIHLCSVVPAQTSCLVNRRATFVHWTKVARLTAAIENIK